MSQEIVYLQELQGKLQRAALEMLKDEAIARAEQACEALDGVVITDDATATAVSDRVKAIKDGYKVAKGLLDGMIKPLRELADAPKHAFKPVMDALERGEDKGKAALSAYLQQKQREQEAERRRLQAEAAAAAKAQAAAGVEAPPMEVLPPAPSRTVTTRKSMTYTISVLRAEAVDLHAIAEFDPDLLVLNEDKAKEFARQWEKDGGDLPAHPAGGFVLHGIRVWREQTIGVK